MPVHAATADPSCFGYTVRQVVAKMPQCFVSSCNNYHKKTRDNPSIIYHSFPVSPTRAQKWLEVCRHKNKKFNPNFARICSEHFSSGCYKRDLQHELLGLPLRKKLKPDAVPDINLPLLSTTISAVDNKISGSGENATFSMRSSIRIAKKRSLESHKASPVGDCKVLQNSTNQLDFMAMLQLKRKKTRCESKASGNSSVTFAADVVTSRNSRNRKR